MIREFKNKPREEMESWREMFERCTTERQEKLNQIKVGVSLSLWSLAIAKGSRKKI